jgi:DinB superfamily
MKRCAIALLSLILGVAAAAQTIRQSERDRAEQELAGSRQAFLDATKGLSPAQWNFKPAPDRWSIAECAEHITHSEDFIFNFILVGVMKTPVAPEKRSEAQGKEDSIISGTVDRSQKYKAADALLPTHQWATTDEMMQHFLESRARAIEYVRTTDDDLRDHFYEHPVFKTIDAYEWILFLSAHTRRHTAQILEVKADPNFPKR